LDHGIPGFSEAYCCSNSTFAFFAGYSGIGGSLGFDRGHATESLSPSDNTFAIVPFQPSPHAVLIQLWAAAKTDSPSTHQESPMAGFCSSVQVALEVQVVEQANHNSDTVMAKA